MKNELARKYVTTDKALSEEQLINLGIQYSKYIEYMVDPVFEPWEFESEDVPEMLKDGLKYGVIKERADED